MKRTILAAVSLSLLVAACGSDNKKKGGSKNPGTTIDPITGKPYDPTLNNPNGTNPNNIPGNIGNAGNDIVGNWVSITAPGTSANGQVTRIQFSEDGRFTRTETNQNNSASNSVLQGSFSANMGRDYINIDLIVKSANGDTNPKAVNPNYPGQTNPHGNNGATVTSQTILCIGRVQTPPVSSTNNVAQKQLLLLCDWRAGNVRPQNLVGNAEAFALSN